MESLIMVLILLGLGFGVGKHLENRHYASIQRREGATVHIPAVSFREWNDSRPVKSVRLASGSVVVSVDYFKRFLAGLRMFFGGELRSYASLIDRARREAVLRMKESCPEADLFLNCRMETSSISKGRKDRIGSVEILAYGTALEFADEIRSETAP